MTWVASNPKCQALDHMEVFKMEGGLPHSSAGLPIWHKADPVHLLRAAYRDIWRSIQAAANADRGASPKTSGPWYSPIINNVVEH